MKTPLLLLLLALATTPFLFHARADAQEPTATGRYCSVILARSTNNQTHFQGELQFRGSDWIKVLTKTGEVWIPRENIASMTLSF